jgi:hypothetical protein
MMDTAKKSKVKVWANKSQVRWLQSTADVNVAVWGRGTGKTTVIGINHYRRVTKLPQARFFLTASTYKQILNNSLPPMIDFWSGVGLEEYDPKTKRGHFVVGQKPPAHFAKPFKAPRHFEHVITFFNGYTIEMLSMDRPSTNRGASFDGGDADELALIKQEYLEQNIIPTIRGNKEKYGYDHPLHGKFSGYTSMPWLSTGQWVLEFEAKALNDPKSFYFQESTARDNLKVLGYDWLDKMEKMLSPEVFQVEVLNQRKIKGENQFYYNFDDKKHVYFPSITYKDDPAGRGSVVDQMSDYSQDQLLDITWDFGGWFTGALILQQTHDRRDAARVTENMINSFYVQKGGSAEDVVNMICLHYSTHKMKYVRIWGEPRGNDKSAHGKTLYEKVVDKFKANGWRCDNMVFQSQAHSHDQRYAYMNEMLAETHRHAKLRCNAETCKAPIMAIQAAERTHDLKKDKKNERDRKFDQKLATHFTDALDYYYMQKHYKARVGLGMSAWTS